MEILLAAFLSGFLLFNSAATPKKAEKVLEAAMHKAYPRATAIDAQVEGKRGRAVLKGNFRRIRLGMSGISDLSGFPFLAAREGAKAGHLGRLELALRDFGFNGVPVESAEFTFNKIAYDVDALKKTSKLMIISSGPSKVHIVIGAASLNTLFADSLKGVRDVKVTLRDGRIVMNAKKVLPLFDLGVPFVFTSRPEARGNEIWLTDGRVDMENTTDYTLPVKNLMGDLNPVFAFDSEKKWPFSVKITDASAQNDKMEINADLTFVGAQSQP